MTRSDRDAEAVVIGEGGLEEGDGALLLLVGQDLEKAMREASSMQTWTNSQPAPRDCVALAAAVAGDAVADPVEAAELLDVDVDQLAGVLALVAADRLGRLEVLEPAQAERA